MEAYISMTGWVGGDVEYKTTSRTNTSCASFRLACTPRLRRGGEWTDGETTWITVTCFRALADNVKASLGKGEPVLVIGRLRTQAWDGEDKQRHERQVLEASTIGHDLTKGSAAFQRTDRPVPEEPAVSMRDLILGAERNAGSPEEETEDETAA